MDYQLVSCPIYVWSRSKLSGFDEKKGLIRFNDIWIEEPKLPRAFRVVRLGLHCMLSFILGRIFQKPFSSFLDNSGMSWFLNASLFGDAVASFVVCGAACNENRSLTSGEDKLL